MKIKVRFIKAGKEEGYKLKPECIYPYKINRINYMYPVLFSYYTKGIIIIIMKIVNKEVPGTLHGCESSGHS